MIQSYLVTEDDNKRLNSNKEVFEWLVTVLDCATRGKRWRGYGFAVIEVVEVRIYYAIRLVYLVIRSVYLYASTAKVIS